MKIESLDQKIMCKQFTVKESISETTSEYSNVEL